MPAAKSVLKLRRLAGGAARPEGHRYQEQERQVRRPNPSRIKQGADDPSLTAVAGLVAFGRFAREHGVDAALRGFDELKTGQGVVYPLGDVLRMLLDAQIAGESRVFALETLAADSLFRELCGGAVAGIDVVYRDLQRMDDEALCALEELASGEGLTCLRQREWKEIHLDLDTTVEPVFGEQMEDARPGPNPRYHGRPSYHPLVVRCAELRMAVGGWLRPGDTALGDDDAETLRGFLHRVKDAVGPDCRVYLRADAAADCAEIMRICEEEQVFFDFKAKLTPNLLAAVTRVQDWRTIDLDADGKPSAQVAKVAFAREDWAKKLRVPVQVVALRARERAGKEVYLWDDLDFSVQVYLTNDPVMPEDEVVRRYDLRAGIEPMIGGLKHHWGLGDVPSAQFNANQAMFLLKLYAFNLWRIYTTQEHPAVGDWSAAWQRRVLVRIPGRLVRSSRYVKLRMPPRAAPLPRPLMVAMPGST